MTEPSSEDVDQLLEAGDLDGARALLAAIQRDDDDVRVLKIKLALYDDSLSPGAAMQRLIQLMRQGRDIPKAKELYQEASNRAYQSRQSSVSHSHPPPPSEDGDDSGT